MFTNVYDLLMLNDLYRDTATTERQKMTEELINYRKFSSEEVKSIIDLSLDELKEPLNMKSFKKFSDKISDK